MAVTKKRIEKNLKNIRQDIAEAADRAGRDPSGIDIVAVTKSVGIEEVKSLLELGIFELAESRAQQLVQRAGELDAYLQRRRNPLPRPPRWHMVGHLQRNKVKSVLGVAEVVHSVDSLRLAEEIDDRAAKMGKKADVFMQVNCSQEEQKFGVAVGAALHLGEMIAAMKNLRLVGLMTMGPLSPNLQETRNAFSRLRELFEEMRSEKIGGESFRHLSMGMSGDYPIAVEQGATMLRIGTALFE